MVTRGAKNSSLINRANKKMKRRDLTLAMVITFAFSTYLLGKNSRERHATHN
jgi:hypothetical protein